MFNFSFIESMDGKCASQCCYCSSCSKERQSEVETTRPYKLDKEAIWKLLENDTRWQNEMKNSHPSIIVDCWSNAGECLDRLNCFRQTVDFLEHCLIKGKSNKIVGYDDVSKLEKGDVYDISIHTSDCGLSFQKQENIDFLHQHHIRCQLSHDGWGQWVRTKEIDPLTWKNTKDNIVSLFKDGTIDWVNCTLSYYNYSFFKNIDFWNKYFTSNNICPDNIFIKLNHSYNSDYLIKEKNVFGHWQDGYSKDLIGTEIGDWGIHGDVCDEYIHEFKVLYLLMLNNPQDQHFKPFRGYIIEQGKRWSNNCANQTHYGSCHDFQKGLVKQTFAIDTEGKYCDCNLMDHTRHVDNEHADQANYCSTCKYRKQPECNSCGSLAFPKKCEMKYKWLECLEELWHVNNLLNNNSKNCNCEKKKQPVYCVKDYQV